MGLKVSNNRNIGSIDIKCAFLQGHKIDRNIYAKPPPEANTTSLWKLQKVIHGLCDAARAPYLRVNEQFHKLGGCLSIYDKASLFICGLRTTSFLEL